MDKSKIRWLIIIGSVLLIGLILIGLFLGQVYRRGKALNSRPLVLILDPDYGDQIQVGDGVIVHATAREDEGLSWIELWVNDVLIDSNQAEESDVTNLTLVSAWTPTFEGEQQIIVRAISADGIPGQAMVQINVIPADVLTHTVEEGETLESIADEYGSSAEELSDLNPGLGGGAPAPGDAIVVPDDEADPEDSPGFGGDSDGEPPEPDGDEPLLRWFFPMFEIFSADPGNVTLKLEMPALRTWESFDSLHCYVSLADSLPQWYPDLDNNQATDESFEAGIHGWWVMEGILVGTSAPIISWPADQPLPLSVACVGVSGGTEALELGVIAMEIPPEEWDGIRHGYESDGEGGHLALNIQVTQLSGDPRNTPKFPDSTMSKPYNVRLNEEEHTLEWDFEAAEGEDIDGFRIYLNENLQWAVDPDARSTRLPPEWFHPPCAWTYTFGVTAYRIEFPDGPESDPPSTFDLEQPREDCMRIMRVTFLELETYDLGDDGRYERRHGDVGPAYGTFYANMASVSFDHGHEGRGLDMVEGLRHNTTYDLALVSGDTGWHFNGSNSIITEVPFEGELQVGFLIMDRDNNPDDEICEGFHFPIRDAYGQLDGYHRESMTSGNGRCRVTFEFEPTEDSPVGERYAGAEPLPWIDLAAYYVDESTGIAHMALRNTGTAAWVDKDLMIEMQTRTGISLGIAVFENVYLETGESMYPEHPLFELEAPYDACVVIDPWDEVLEYYERSGALYHHPICQDLPDLVIENAHYESFEGNRIVVEINNIGDGPVANRTVTLEVRDPSGGLLMERTSFDEVGHAVGRTHFYQIVDVPESVRPRMVNGYSVTVNPSGSFAESNLENNTFSVGESKDLAIKWYAITGPYGVRDAVDFHIDAYIYQGNRQKEQVVDWNVNHEIDWGSCNSIDNYCSLLFVNSDYQSHHFDIFGDESLVIRTTINHPGTLWHDFSTSDSYKAPSWGAGGNNPGTDSCSFWPTREAGDHRLWFNNGAGSEWFTRYDICMEDIGE